MNIKRIIMVRERKNFAIDKNSTNGIDGKPAEALRDKTDCRTKPKSMQNTSRARREMFISLAYWMVLYGG